MQYSAHTVKPTILKDEPISHKEAAKRMGKFLKKHDELRENEATTQEHLHTVKDALEASAKK